MKRILIILMLLTAFVITACNPYLLSVWQLKGETFVFITNANGLDYISFTFNDDGISGTMETGSYTYGFATEAADTSGLYTDQSWYMNSGTRGSFTYDEETGTTTTTVTEEYARIPGVSTRYEDDYSWRGYLAIQIESNGNVTAASQTITQTVVFNSDSTDYDWFFIKDGESSWRNSWEEATSITAAGVVTDTTSTDTTVLTIVAGSLTSSRTIADYEKVGADTPTYSTRVRNNSYTITNFYISGKETGDTEFDNAWKSGNTVTFLGQGDVRERIDYEGSTAPDASFAPAVDGVTGIGNASGGTAGIDEWTWDIFQDEGDVLLEETYIHYGDFILSKEGALSSYRGIE